MDISKIFSILAGVFMFLGYVLYDKEIFLGRCKPNVISWSLWTMTSTINLASYFAVTGDIMKISLSVVSSFFCIVTLIIAIAKKNCKPITSYERCTLGIVLTSLVAWYIFKSSLCANVIVQFATIIAFVPTYQNAWKTPSNENLTAWIIFTLSFVMLLVTVSLRWNGQIESFIYPILGVILHTIVVAIIIYSRKMKSKLLK